MTAEVIALATAKLSPQERGRVEHEKRELAAGKVAIRTRHDALAWGDAWRSYALWVEAQNARTQMLLYCAEANARASELLLEHAVLELERLREGTK